MLAIPCPSPFGIHWPINFTKKNWCFCIFSKKEKSLNRDIHPGDSWPLCRLWKSWIFLAVYSETCGLELHLLSIFYRLTHVSWDLSNKDYPENLCNVKLNGVGPIDNNPLSTSSTTFFYKSFLYTFFLYMWHVTCNMWHMTGWGRWTFSNNFSSLVWEWSCT